jgi:ribosome biogenesis GTPase A
MADPVVTRAWIAHLEIEGQVAAMASTTERPQEARKRIAELTAGFGLRGTPNKPVRALIAGVPNVGKSTLINTLMGTNVAAVSDRPAVTKRQQRVVLKNGTVVTDTPGLMWPKIEHDADGYMLAASHAIGVNAVIEEEVATYLADLLLERYPDLLAQRYGLAPVGMDGVAVIEAVAARRGCRLKGGAFDLEKAALLLLGDYRSGALGRISLETPQSRAQMLAAAVEAAAEQGEDDPPG